MGQTPLRPTSTCGVQPIITPNGLFLFQPFSFPHRFACFGRHQDHSWRGNVTRYELSYADETPLGGDVLFADAVRAHQTLSPRLRALLEGATSLAVLANGYQNLSLCDSAYAKTMLEHPPVEQPVIAIDPDTGERWLNVNTGYSVRIPELSACESAALLPMLCAHVSKPDHCVRLQYSAGDVVIFDNHRLQHYAVSDYYPAPRRIMRMSFDAQKISGAPPSPMLAPTLVPPPPEAPSEPMVDAIGGRHSLPAAPPDAAAKPTVKPATQPGSAASLSTPSATVALSPSLGRDAAAAAHAATQLTAGLRLLARGGQADLCAGFFSARHPHRPDLFLAPSHGTHWHEATPSAFGVFRTSRRAAAPAQAGEAAGCGGGLHERIAGEGPMPNFPSTAVSAAIYAAMPEVNAIVHAHPRSMMALAALDASTGHGKVLPMSEPSFMFYERVAHLPCNFFFDDDYLAQTVEALRGGAFCVCMRNHSYTMVGKSIQECYLRCYMLEQSASIQLQALSANGGKLPPIPDRDECLFHRRSYEGYDGCAPYDGRLEWPGLVRSLDRDEPSWRGDGGEALAAAYEKATA